jgi:putative transposase
LGRVDRPGLRVLEVDTSTHHYKSRRRDQVGVEARIKEIAQARVRYGYRRVHVLLRREGWTDSVKLLYRIYHLLGLQLRKKPPQATVRAKLRDYRQAAVRPNDVWAMDFVHDQLATGQKLRVLTIVDIFSRFCPGLDVRFRYRAEDVAVTLERVCQKIGIRARSGSIRGRSLSAGTWIYGLTRRVWSLISHGPASRRTMRSSRPSTVGSDQNP